MGNCLKALIGASILVLLSSCKSESNSALSDIVNPPAISPGANLNLDVQTSWPSSMLSGEQGLMEMDIKNQQPASQTLGFSTSRHSLADTGCPDIKIEGLMNQTNTGGKVDIRTYALTKWYDHG